MKRSFVILTALGSFAGCTSDRAVEPPGALQAPSTPVVNAPAADVVADLKATGEGDILVNSSPSVIKALLSADLIDRLYLLVLPEIVGGGERLFEDGLPASTWTLTRQETGAQGEMALVYDCAR